MPSAARRKQAANPFYLLVVLVGIAFTVTACSYGLMAFRELRFPRPATPSRMFVFLNRHGMSLLAAEVALLGVVSLAAMGTDRVWREDSQNRLRRLRDSDNEAFGHQPPSAVPPPGEKNDEN